MDRERTSRGYEERWERARPGRVADLEGDWRVERLSGPVPMPFVWKRVRQGRGRTRALPFSRRVPALEPGLPFGLQDHGGHVALIYSGPLSFLVDELRREESGASWLGRAHAAGVFYAWFRMHPM